MKNILKTSGLASTSLIVIADKYWFKNTAGYYRISEIGLGISTECFVRRLRKLPWLGSAHEWCKSSSFIIIVVVIIIIIINPVVIIVIVTVIIIITIIVVAVIIIIIIDHVGYTKVIFH